VQLSFLQILNRYPTPQELQASVDFLQTQSKRLAEVGQAAAGADSVSEPDTRARENLVHALMNHNDFVTVR
jgi:hypothetical protein